MDATALTPSLICPEPYAKSFEVNGVGYTLTEGLAVGRGRYLDRFITEQLFGLKVHDYNKTLDSIESALDRVSFVDAAYQVRKLKEGQNIVGGNRLRSLEICALFFNAPGEDPAVYDFDAMQEKCYTAWRAVHRDFFLQWSHALWNGGDSRYNLTEAPENPAA